MIVLDPRTRRQRCRLWWLTGGFAVLFLGLIGQLLHLGAVADTVEQTVQAQGAGGHALGPRANVYDRNGQLLATNLKGRGVGVHPGMLADINATAQALAAIFPDLDAPGLAQRFRARRAKLPDGQRRGMFTRVKRRLTPAQQQQVWDLGIPGVEFEEEDYRYYPQRALTAHVVGHVDGDNWGVSGIEKSFNEQLTGFAARPTMATDSATRATMGDVRLALDIRVQRVARDALAAAIEAYRAIGGNAVVVDVTTGEVLAMVSLPDFDPNHDKPSTTRIATNRNVMGVYEQGSMLKLLAAATALESGTAHLGTRFDVSQPCRVPNVRKGINDFRGHKRVINLAEAVMFSSNIAFCQVAQGFGAEVQRAYFQRFGLFDRHPIELPDAPVPLQPKPWRLINTVTAAYGQGIAITPIHLLDAVATIVNDGVRRPLTVLAQESTARGPIGRVISPETSAIMRYLMWLVVAKGGAAQADIPDYMVGGKTGTAYKVEAGRYNENRRLSSFIGVVPAHRPRYVVLVSLDEPQGNDETFGYATGGWVAAPTVRAIIEGAAPFLALNPVAPAVRGRFETCIAESSALNGRTQREETAYAVVCTPR